MAALFVLRTDHAWRFTREDHVPHEKEIPLEKSINEKNSNERWMVRFPMVSFSIPRLLISFKSRLANQLKVYCPMTLDFGAKFCRCRGKKSGRPRNLKIQSFAQMRAQDNIMAGHLHCIL